VHAERITAAHRGILKFLLRQGACVIQAEGTPMSALYTHTVLLRK
jgi:hypothetical protein